MKQKKCGVCKMVLNIDNFSPKRKDGIVIGYRYNCKNCRKVLYKKNPKKHIDRAKIYYKNNSDKIKLQRFISYSENYIKHIWKSAKCRAKKQNVPFEIDIVDIIIPKYCPVLGIELIINRGRCRDNSPSLDKIIPELGYVKGNIAVISHKANTIKNNSSIDDLIKIYNYYCKDYILETNKN